MTPPFPRPLHEQLSYLVSCNVDSLHLRGGFPRARLAELHGNCFAERCERCSAERVRDFEQATVARTPCSHAAGGTHPPLLTWHLCVIPARAQGFKLTGRACDACGGRTRDQVLDWDDALPPDELAAAEAHSKRADLALTLGASEGASERRRRRLRTMRPEAPR